MTTKYTKADTETTHDERLAAAYAEANITSGVAALPAANVTPEAVAGGEIIKNVVPEVAFDNPAVNAVRTAMTIAQIEKDPLAKQALGETGLAILKADSARMEEALSKQAPAAPPVQIGMGQSQFSVPGDVRTAPYDFHTKNPFGAKDTWFYFLPQKEKRGKMAMLAAQGGMRSTPLLWWSQQVYSALVLWGFKIQKAEGDLPFDETDRDRNGSQFTALRQCVGLQSATEIYQQCERENVSILTGIDHLVDYLIERDENELLGVQRNQSMDEWT